MIKKILYCLSIIFVAFVFFSCKSKDVPSDELAISEENVEIIDNDEEKQKSKKDRSDKKEVDADNEAEVLTKEEKSDKSFIGWIDMGVKNPEFEDGIVKIKTNSKLGTFCIYVVDEKGKSHPVLSSLNEYTTSSFYLKAGKKIFKLAANEKVKTGISEQESGVKIVYNIKNTADVVVEINTFPSVENRPADTLKFTVNVKNIGSKVDSFAVKTILDTVLGENGSFHFYNYEGKPVKNEILLESLDDDGWFVSKNDKASLQILLDGGDTTAPELLSLANYKTLENAKWEPTMQAFGAFDTVLSYNNSAVGVIWPEKRLKPDESYTLTFYLSLGLDGMIPNGYRYVYNLGAPEPEPEKKEKTAADFMRAKDEERKAAKTASEKTYDKENVKNDGKEESEDKKSDEKNNEKDETSYVDGSGERVTTESVVPNIEFNVDNISKDHLTQEYVDSLLNRITELEGLGASANRGEILELNAELDAILSILR